MLLQTNQYVVATKEYRTNEATLLSFKRGDVIKLMEADVDEGLHLFNSLIIC